MLRVALGALYGLLLLTCPRAGAAEARGAIDAARAARVQAEHSHSSPRRRFVLVAEADEEAPDFESRDGDNAELPTCSVRLRRRALTHDRDHDPVDSLSASLTRQRAPPAPRG